MKRLSMFVALAGFLQCLMVVSAGCPACAQCLSADTYYPNDSTINSLILNAVVGFADCGDLSLHANGTSPTITIVSGANIGALEVYNSSTVNVDGGGFLDFFVYVAQHDSSTANIRGGYGWNSIVWYALDNSTLNVYGHDLTGWETWLGIPDQSVAEPSKTSRRRPPLARRSPPGQPRGSRR